MENKLDKVIESLKEINDILRETNLEMAKCLHGDKPVHSAYVVQFGANENAFLQTSSYTDQFWYVTVNKATQYPTKQEAEKDIKRAIAECDRQFATIKKVKMVIEND